MNYLSAENISKSYGERLLFEGLNFGLSRGQKVAMVGLNGSGKSTVLRVLSGELPPDTGNISFRKGIVVRYLKQVVQLDDSLTVWETLLAAENETIQLICDYELAMLDTTTSSAKMEALVTQMDNLKAWDYEATMKEVLGKLGFTDLNQSVKVLSGGQRKRLGMARALIEKPDLLIMDEPTNHLDVDAIEWLEKYLNSQNQTVLMVTHDRYFLNHVADEIFELDQGRLFRYKGNYEYYLEKKAEREAMEEVNAGKAQNLLKVELEWMRRQPKARGTKSKARISNFEELSAKSKNQYKQGELQLKSFGGRLGNTILELHHVSHSFGDLKILDKFDYKFRKGERVGIVGKNGVGKSTFLKILTEELTPDKGKVKVGVNTAFGYYRQEGLKFKPNQRVLEVVQEVAEHVQLTKSESISAKRLLEMFLFPSKTHGKMVEKLSGGEKRRLNLLRVLIQNPNFLILDEPTNDLDLLTLNVLEKFLADFQGCLIIVSHDRYFMNKLCQHLFVFEGEGQIKDFPGNYDHYKVWQEEEDKKKKIAEKEAAQLTETIHSPKKEKEKTKLTFNENREYEQLSADIDRLEQKQVELSELLNSGNSDHEQLLAWSTEIEQITKDLEVKSERWLELSEFVE